MSGGRLSDGSRYEILYDLPRGTYNRAEVGGIRTRTWRMGDIIEVECYPLTRIGAAARAEAAARHKQRACQAALNRRHAEARVRRLITLNFGADAYVMTLTWDYGAADLRHMSYEDAMARYGERGLPLSEGDARKALRAYWQRVRRMIARQGGDPKGLKYLYVLEMTHSNRQGPRPEPVRYHFHLVIEAPGLDRDALQALWPHGDARCDRLSVRAGKIAGLAKYLTKHHSTEEVDTDGRRIRRWDHSRNLREPFATVSDRKVSRRRAAMVAADVAGDAQAVFSAVYPGHELEEEPVIRYSDYCAGAYIYARLRRTETRGEGDICGVIRGRWRERGSRRSDTPS